MTPRAPKYEARMARSEAEVEAAQRLRYEVFVAELGSGGAGVDHGRRLETDRFDPFFDHLLLIDHAAAGGPAVVGTYRVMPGERAPEAGGFYSAGEYDLSPLIASGRRLLELGRSCLHRNYRGGGAMAHLWGALARYVLAHGFEVLFGVASFHGTDVAALAQPLSHLHRAHLAPPDLRVRALPDHYQPMDLLPPEAIDRRKAMLATPQLIKAYLRLGGFVGDGAFVDHAFNTTDVCLILDVARMTPRQRELYARPRG